jgi:voltage-gated potassium channel Kch
VLLETVDAVHYILAIEFAVLDSIAVAVFTTEYLMRMYSVVEDPKYKEAYAGRARYGFTLGAMIDLLAVLPFFLEALLHHLFDLRFLRIFRMLRLLKLTRFSDATKLVWDGIKREAGTIGASFFVLLLVIILCGSIGYLLEHAAQPDKFESIPGAIYWSVITLSSVGYGDISPVTPLGRFITSLMALLGIALIAIPSGILAAAFTDQLRIEREKIGAKIVDVMDDDHIDPEEKAQLEADARRLHITHLELDEMIKVAKARKAQERAVRREFNLNAASLDPRLAMEQIRGIVEQMQVIVRVSDEKLAHVMGSSDSPTNLEKRIFNEILAEQRAAQAKPH